MPLKWRQRVLLAKIETTEGVDAVPTGEANAIQVIDLQIKPLAGGTVRFDYLRPDLGGRPQIQVDNHLTLEFSVALAGAGAAGTAPAYGPLLRGCGMSEAIAASPAMDAVATAAAGAVGTFTYTVSSAYTGTVPRTVTLTCTTPGGSGVAQFTVSAPAAGTHPAHSALAQTMTNATPFALVGGAAISPSVGTSFQAGDSYSIALRPANVLYRPVGSDAETLTIYVNVDGNLHKAVGCRGTVAVEYSIADFPRLKFMFVCQYVAPVAQALPTAALSAFRTPLPGSNANTPDFKLFNADGVLRSLTLNLGVENRHRDYVNSAKVLLVDRNATGTVNMEAPLISDWDPFAAARNTVLGPLRLNHGITAGNIAEVTCPTVQILDPNYEDDQGITMLTAALSLIPSDAGNDELQIRVM